MLILLQRQNQSLRPSQMLSGEEEEDGIWKADLVLTLVELWIVATIQEAGILDFIKEVEDLVIIQEVEVLAGMVVILATIKEEETAAGMVEILDLTKEVTGAEAVGTSQGVVALDIILEEVALDIILEEVALDIILVEVALDIIPEVEGSSLQFMTLVILLEMYRVDQVMLAEGLAMAKEGMVGKEGREGVQVTSAVGWLIITAAWVGSSAIPTMSSSAREWTSHAAR